MPFEHKPIDPDIAELKLESPVSEVVQMIDDQVADVVSAEDLALQAWIADLRAAEGESKPSETIESGITADFLPDSAIDAGAGNPPGGDDFLSGPRRKRLEDEALVPGAPDRQNKPKRPGGDV